MAAVEAWFLGGPVDGRLMPVEVTAEGSPPAVVRLPQTGFYVGASDVGATAVEHVYVLTDRLDDTEVYQYRQPASPRAALLDASAVHQLQVRPGRSPWPADTSRIATWANIVAVGRRSSCSSGGRRPGDGLRDRPAVSKGPDRAAPESRQPGTICQTAGEE